MDELKDTWEQLKADSHHFQQLTVTEIRTSIHQKSNGLLEKLTRRVRVKFILCVIGTVTIAAAIPFITPFVSQILLSILLIGYLVGAILLYQELEKLKREISIDENLLSRLVAFRSRIVDVIRYEELIGIILYPISAAGGYFFGLRMAAPHIPLMETPKDWGVFIVLVLVITPLGHLATRWMNRLSFGKILEELNQNIADLESHEG